MDYVLRTNNLILTLSDEGYIKSLIDGKKEIIGRTKLPVFELLLRDELGDSKKIDTFQTELLSVNFDDTSVKMTYGISNSVVITYIAKIDNDTIYWSTSVNNSTQGLIEWITFPQFCINNDLKGNGGDGSIIWPYNEGVVCSSIEDRENNDFKFCEPEYPSMGCFGIFPNMLQSQFIAYSYANSGLYVGMEDEQRGLKCIDFYPETKDDIRFILRNYTNKGYSEDYRQEYFTVFKTYDGNWQSAAELYRDWFYNHNENYKKIIENSETPEWYHDSPIIVAYPVRGQFDTDVMEPNKLFPYTNALPIIEDLNEKLDSRIMALLMHWEGTAPWAPPFVWPPFGGERLLDDFAKKLHEKRNLLGLYCSGFGWTEQSKLIPSYNMSQYFNDHNLKEAMCVSPSQELELSKICRYQRSGYDFCPACDTTKEIFLSETEKICSSGADYIQLMDQNHGGNSYFCYSKNHGHNPAPGKWMIDSSKEIYKELHKHMQTRLFGCESAAAEPFINDLLFSDNRFELNYFMGKAIPLYSYIYHEYINNFMGNQVCMNIVPDKYNFLFRLAYSFIAGDMLTLVINQDGKIAQNWGADVNCILPAQEEAMVFLSNANAWRRCLGKNYLHYGKMEKTIPLNCEYNEFETDTGLKFTESKLLSSCWSSSGEEKFAQFVANYNLQDVDFVLSDNFGGNVEIYFDPQKDDKTVYKSGDTITIKALSSIMIKFKK